MREYEPKLKKKVFNREFFSKYIYVLVIGLCLLLGVSYGLTFFTQNKNIATGSITTSELTVTFTDRNLNFEDKKPPATDQAGLSLYTKSLTITNTTNTDGKVKLTITRTSGLNLSDMKYAIIVNGAIQQMGDIPLNGEILSSAIMANETLDVELKLWPKTTYTGGQETFVGQIVPEIKYFGSKASSISNPAGKYVSFNCDNEVCEEWRIVKVQDERLVLTKTADYDGATERAWTGKYYSGLVFNDDSMISSVSDDNDHKNVYLMRTVKIESGTGTQADPYVLSNNIISEPDKKVIAQVTYKDGTTTLGTQNVYYGETNYISKTLSDLSFQYWDDGSNHYLLGDTITTITSDTNLTAHKNVNSDNISFDNTITGFNCTDVQCALEALNDYAS